MFHVRREQWHALEFPGDVAPFQRFVSPCLRFSVALPLGINGAACSRWARGWSYPNGLDLGGWGQRGRNEHHDVAALWVARVTPHPLTNNSSPPPAESATSSVKLQPSACRGGGLCGSKSSKSNAFSSGFGLSPIPPKPLRGLGDEAGGSPNRRPRSQFKRSKPAGFGVEADSKRRCASLRGGRLRPARLCESQKLDPARRENWLRFSRLKNRHSPKHCPVSASLRLRYRSATFPSPAAILAGLAQSQPAEYAILGGRATVFTHRSLTARGRVLIRLKLPCAGGGRVTPAGRSDTTYRLTCSAQFLVRACAIHLYSANHRNS